MASGRYKVYQIIRENWYATHSKASQQYHSVITLGVPLDFFDRTLFKPPNRSTAWLKAFGMMRD